MEIIGHRITAAREALGYTQAQLAERIPCNPQTVSNWETGRRQPRYADLLRLAEVLGRPVSWLLGEDATDAGWESVRAAIERATDELANVRRLVDERRRPAGGARLVPIAGRIEGGARPMVVREPEGWRVLPVEQAEGLTIYRVAGDAHYPVLQPGDLVAVQPADSAEAGALVTARLDDGTELLARLGADGGLETINPAYAPERGPYTITAVVRWQHRDLQPVGDPAELAAAELERLRRAEQEVLALEARIERGDGQWTDLVDYAEEVATAAEALRGVYGSAAVAHAALALSRCARALGELGRYAEALAVARRAEDHFVSIERVGERSRDALNNLYNLSQLALFLGDLATAAAAAETAATCADWRVRWKALKNLAEIRANFQGAPAGESLCADILALAEAHEAEDPVEAALARSVAHEIRGNAAFTRGDLSAARAAAAAQLAAAEAAGLPYRIANALIDLGAYAAYDGDAGAALEALGRAAPYTADQSLGDLDALRESHYAAALALEGNLARARVALHSAMRRAATLGSQRAALAAELAGLILAGVADDPLAREDHASAARGYARRLGLAPYERVIDRFLTETRR